MKPITLLLFVLSTTIARGENFETWWHDGKAELNGYKLQVSRYGQTREGHAVSIYVTEPFSESKRVKVDDHTRDPADTFDALKLNLVRDFQTGIYDYNTMVSVFVRSADFSPVKVSFSSAEWCGHVYEELLFFPDRIVGQYFSYFENESGPRNLDAKPGGVHEDNLWILLRGLRGEFLKPGEKKTVPFLPSVYHGRLAHKAPVWTTAEIVRETKTEKVKTPAGLFEVTRYPVTVAGGRVGAFLVEASHPHRIVRWELPPDISAELTGSMRSSYWRQHNNGDEKLLKELGLPKP